VNEMWIDRIAVVATVMFAAAWLLFNMRRSKLKRKEDQAGKVGKCGSTCEGCPYGDNCGGKV
jgi:hypothetical protein